MNKNQVILANPSVFVTFDLNALSSPVAAIQFTDLEIMQENEEEAMVGYIRAKRAGRAKRELLRDRKESNRI